jgi:predicted glutamine amidotransferase
MCRIATYIGPSISIENIVTAPLHSLLSQSRYANESKVEWSGDGFGVAWYGQREEPGLYRECLPAWSDENLISMCRTVQSHLFIAHVRASTTGETMRANCHPFSYKKWCFAHNGQIGGFSAMQRELEALLCDEFYNIRRGTTDSELLFLLMLQFGIEDSPISACNKVIHTIEDKRRKLEISEPLRLTFVFSNGNQLYGVRYASDKFCPTLYLSGILDNGGVSLSSEPLDGNSENWTMVEPATMIEISSGNTAVHHIQTL